MGAVPGRRNSDRISAEIAAWEGSIATSRGRFRGGGGVEEEEEVEEDDMERGRLFVIGGMWGWGGRCFVDIGGGRGRAVVGTGGSLGRCLSGDRLLDLSGERLLELEAFLSC